MLPFSHQPGRRDREGGKQRNRDVHVERKRQYRPSNAAIRNSEPPTSEPNETAWPCESADAGRRFGRFTFIWETRNVICKQEEPFLFQRTRG